MEQQTGIIRLIQRQRKQRNIYFNVDVNQERVCWKFYSNELSNFRAESNSVKRAENEISYEAKVSCTVDPKMNEPLKFMT